MTSRETGPPADQALPPSRFPRVLPPVADGLAIAVACSAGWAIGIFAWDRIQLPFSNPYGIVGPLTLLQFNPLNNQVRYGLFVGLPAVIYAALLSSAGRRVSAARTGAEAPLLAPCAVVALLFATAGIWTALRVGAFLSLSFAPSPLDFFHHGEWLAPAWNYVVGRGLWRGSFFLHGAFYDPLATALGWWVFGQQTIGAALLMQAWLKLLIAPALAASLVALALCVEAERRAVLWNVIVLLALILTTLLTNQRLQTLAPRDVPLLCGLAAFLFGVAFRHRAWLFAAGLCSSAAYFYVIDRGAYFSAALLITLAVVAWRDRPADRRTLGWCLAGIAFGWAVFAIAVGAAEFGAFLQTTAFIYGSKDLFDSYIYPNPDQLTSVVTVAPLLCISLQGVLVVRALARRGRREAIAAQIFVAALALVSFRSALGRSDAGHVAYSSFFAYSGLGLALCNAFGSQLAARRRWLPPLAAGLVTLIAAAAWSDAPRYDAVAALHAPARMRALVAAPDDAFLSVRERRVRDRLRELTRGDACFFTFTSEAAWNFLLRQPSCGRHSIVWFASAAPLQQEIERDLDRYRPSHILLRSPGWPNAIDGIDNAQRLPALTAALARTYEPVEDLDGFVIAQRREVEAP
ncbi:MAG: hypothetical protein ABI629_20620 [bacterium]